MLYPLSLVRMESLPICPRFTPYAIPKADINRIWKAMPESEWEYVNRLMGEVPLLANYIVDWPLLEALTDFWDAGKAVFIINGAKLTPTLEEYQQLVQGLE